MKKVLVIEDEERIRRVVALQLELEGYEVREAESAREGLALIEEQRPDLVILDYLLPDMSGGELVGLLRGLPGGEGLPVLLLSGLDREDLEPELLGDPLLYFLPKPFDVRRLMVSVREAVKRG